MLIGIEFLVFGDFSACHKGTTSGVTVLFLFCFLYVHVCVCVCVSMHACPPNVNGPIEEQWLAGLQVDENANFDDGSKGPNMSDW
jgi:hypothetical protein